jgi:hypothetical protein
VRSPARAAARKAETTWRWRASSAAGTTGVPCTLRRARLASFFVATGVRSTIAAISSNGTANMSCSTNAIRSAGCSVSSTTSNARLTESASKASSSDGCPGQGPRFGRAPAAQPGPLGETCGSATCQGRCGSLLSAASRTGCPPGRCRPGPGAATPPARHHRPRSASQASGRQPCVAGRAAPRNGLPAHHVRSPVTSSRRAPSTLMTNAPWANGSSPGHPVNRWPADHAAMSLCWLVLW